MHMQSRQKRWLVSIIIAILLSSCQNEMDIGSRNGFQPNTVTPLPTHQVTHPSMVPALPSILPQSRTTQPDERTISPRSTVTSSPTFRADASLAYCTAAMLTSASEREGATGFVYTWIDYTNHTESSCIVSLPPNIRLFDTTGVPLRATYETRSYDTAYGPAHLIMRPGAAENETIVPAKRALQLIISWEGICPPTTATGIVAYLTLKEPDEVVKTLITSEPRTCNEVGWTPYVTITGYRLVQ